MHTQLNLQVGVVGAGIAGLAAVVALRRAGHDVEVFERSKFKNEVGAAITAAPNLMRVLDRWGFDTAKFGGVELQQLRMKLGTDLSPVFEEAFGSLKPRYGHQNLSFHRVDLHNGLMELAKGKNLPGALAGIRLATEVTGVDCEQGELTLSTGEKARKDLLIIADGAHCHFVNKISPTAGPMKKTGRSVFRMLIPSDRIMADADTRALFDDELPGFLMTFEPVKGVFCITYPCRSGEIMNCAVLHDTQSDQQDSEDWNSPASMENVMECTSAFHPTIQKLLKMTDEVKVFTLMHRAPLDRFTNGKTILIGDAAHSMIPTHAQAAAVALEDAAALEVLFSEVDHPDLVQERVPLFDKIRLPRAVMTQLVSNAGHGKHGEVEEEVKKYYSGPLPPPGTPAYSEPWRDIFFGYDIFEESAKAILCA